MKWKCYRAGLDEIQSALAIHPDPPAGPPGSPPPRTSVDTGEPRIPATPPRLPGTPRPTVASQQGPSQLRLDATERPWEPEGDYSRCRGCDFWLGRPIRTQRHLPASTVQIIDSISCAILTQLQNPALSPQSRRIFLALALLMPRWLWPEPPHPEGTTLPAHSRPRLVQARAQLFRDGDLDALLAHLAPDEEDCPEPPAPPRTPGVLQQSDCHRLLEAGKQGRLTTAWKQLFSCGIAPANDATAALLRTKWLPAPLFPEELRGRYSTPGVAKAHLTEEAIQQACRKLTRGSAMDALGWSHEAWTKLHQLPHGKVLLQELLLLYCNGRTWTRCRRPPQCIAGSATT